MKWRMILLAVLLTLCSALLLTSPVPAADDAMSGEVRKDVEKTLDLWRDGRFEDVYRRIIESGGHTKEYFIAHLVAAPRRPSCCWEKMQEVRITVKNQRQATLTAKFGFDTGVGVEFMTKGLKLEKEDGVWKIKMSEVLSLSGKGKKMTGGKKKSP
jgi:hypothetical protein